MRTSFSVFVLASLPAALVGVWNLGTQLREVPVETAGIWQLEMFGAVLGGLDGTDHLMAAVLGLAFFLPLLLTSLAVSRAWAEVFARGRGRPLDSGWVLTAWLYTLLLPATMPLAFAALCLSFGLLFGCHVFGGTGRYIVNPALLGIVFAAIAYPNLVADTQGLPGAGLPSSWAVSVNAGEAGVAQPFDWAPLFLGSGEIGAIGTSSDFACLLGAVFLIARGAASVRVIVAGLAGLAVAGALLGELPWYWHLALGNVVFVLAFVATDPTTRPATKGGCWAFGALLGILTVVLRIANPDHPEGAWSALLLASLLVPLLDHIVRAGLRSRRPEPLNDG